MTPYVTTVRYTGVSFWVLLYVERKLGTQKWEFTDAYGWQQNANHILTVHKAVHLFCLFLLNKVSNKYILHFWQALNKRFNTLFPSRIHNNQAHMMGESLQNDLDCRFSFTN